MNIDAPIVTYWIHHDGRAIECLRCGMVSTHPEDVRHRYCGYCHEFHDADGATAAMTEIEHLLATLEGGTR